MYIVCTPICTAHIQKGFILYTSIINCFRINLTFFLKNQYTKCLFACLSKMIALHCMHTTVCTPLYAHHCMYMYTTVCTPLYVHHCMYTTVCTPLYALHCMYTTDVSAHHKLICIVYSKLYCIHHRLVYTAHKWIYTVC